MLRKETTALLLIDVQGKLARLMHEKELLFENLQKLVKGMRILDIPILWMEQNPAGLGPTIPEIAELLPDIDPISKMSFSCCRNDRFLDALKRADRRQLVVAGIEAHICVYQTVAQLQERGYETHVVADAVSSRIAANKDIGLEKMKACGGAVTSVETVLFELLAVAQGAAFKAISKIVK